jgi:diguanylate cyclase (GGDEF)-like protein/PAS domain S-box-containing protein
MTTSSSDEPPHGPSARSVLVEAWLRALAPTGFTPWPREEFEELISTQVDAIAEGLATTPVSVDAAQRAGAELVAASFTDSESLRASLRVLARGLVAIAETDGVADPGGRAAVMLGAFGAGYTAALRDWLFDQQEEVKQALQRATGEAQRRLRRSEAWFREVFERAAVGIAISDSGGGLAQVNPALAEILGCQPADLVGRSLEEFFHPQDGIDIKAEYHELAGLGGRPLRRRRRLVRPDGQLVWVYLAVSVLRDADEVPTLHLTMVENVSDLHLLQDLTSHQALHDVLTGLPNRQYLLSQLQSQLGGLDADGQVTLYHVDLDGFSSINHGLGPEHGDRLMTVVARRLEGLFAGQRALVARLSGDEFAVLFSAGSSPAEVLDTVSRINDQLAEPVHLPGGGVGLSATIGVAHGQVGEIDPFELLRRADVTLRRAQTTGSRQWAEYDQPRDVVDRRSATLAATLSGALEFGDLTVRWQPWTSLAHGHVNAVSARVGWNHPEHGPIDHAECLALADRSGAAVSLAAWLIEIAAERSKAWWDRFGDRTPPIGVGLTNSQVADPDLVGTVAGALEAAGIRPASLRLGVPTRAVTADSGEARDNIGVLTSMGVGVLLVDAGLAPVDMMLLDEWPIIAMQMANPLVRAIADADPGSRLVRTTEAMVRSLVGADVPIVVSGLRTAREVEWWRSAGASSACGPYFGPHLDAEEATSVLIRRETGR